MKNVKRFTQKEIREIRSKINVSVESTGKFIRETRVQHHLSQTSLGSVLYVTKKAVSKWERGLCYPSMDVLPYLAETLGVTTDEIIFARFDNENKYEDSNKALKIIYKIFKNKHVKLIIKCILTIVFICLAWFFFENYNAVKIYTLYSKDESIHIDDTLLVTTPINDYINIGYIYIDFPDIDENTQINYVLYIGDENKIERVIIQYNMQSFMPHIANSNYEEVPKNKIPENLDRIYLQITYVNKDGLEQEHIIKMNTYLKYQSNDLITFLRERDSIFNNNDNILKLKNTKQQDTQDNDNLEIDLSFLYDMTEEERKEKYDSRNITINKENIKIYYNKNTIRIFGKNKNIKLDFNENRIYVTYNNRFVTFNINQKKAFFHKEYEKTYKMIDEIINAFKQF